MSSGVVLGGLGIVLEDAGFGRGAQELRFVAQELCCLRMRAWAWGSGDVLEDAGFGRRANEFGLRMRASGGSCA